jgi:murein DD-endopeptidase MepM/ murein hydrolase activator NlpD
VLGYVGCTGTCLRPHVHFQVKLGSGQTAPVADPAPFIAAKPRIRGGAPLEEAAR